MTYQTFLLEDFISKLIQNCNMAKSSSGVVMKENTYLNSKYFCGFAIWLSSLIISQNLNILNKFINQNVQKVEYLNICIL